MKVLKFGGTSVGTPERMGSVAKIITSDDHPKIIVLSAVSGTTNSLVEIGSHWHDGESEKVASLIETLYNHYSDFVQSLFDQNEYLEEGIKVVEKHFNKIKMLTAISFNHSSNKELLAQGELLSTNLFFFYLQQIGVKAKLIPALDFMRIDVDGEPDLGFLRQHLAPFISGNDTIFITQGFICKNHQDEIANLKRGGSDYTASLIGAAISAKEVQIWTDIDGMHNNDPRIVPDTFPIQALSFDEAAELAYFGAKILHPNTVWPAQKGNIPVKLLNTMVPEAKGTIISGVKNPGSIKAIAAKEGITAIKIKSSRMLLAYGFMRKIFEIFEHFKVPIDMITTSEVAVSLTIDSDDHLGSLVEALKEYGDVAIDKDLTIVCVVGDLIAEQKGIAKRVFDCTGDQPIRMISYGGSRNNISLLVPTTSKKEILLALNSGLFSPSTVS